MKTILTLIILIIIAPQGQAQSVLTLDAALEAALEYNFDLRISAIETDKVENMATRGNAGQLPSLFIDGGLNLSYSNLELTPGSFFVDMFSGSQPQQSPGAIEYDGVTTTSADAGIATQFVIYNGMKAQNRYKLLKTGSKIAGMKHQAEMELTILEITSQYIQAATLQKAIELKELVLEQSRDRFRTIETRNEYGQITEQQRLQALSDLKTDSSDYQEYKLEFENAFRKLHNLIGWERQEILRLEELSEPTMPLDYEQLQHSIKSNNTSLAMREYLMEQAKLDYDIAKGNFLPSITANARYGYNYQNATDGQFETQEQLGVMGGISLKIPIFTGGRNKIVSQNAKATIQQKELQHEASEKQLNTQFKNTWSRLQYLENKLDTDRNNLMVYERNYERAKDTFERGLITGVELRNAQIGLQKIRLSIIETEFQIHLVRTQLLHLSGQLITQS